jgi:Kef-type K+ transport system membrane component KefB
MSFGTLALIGLCGLCGPLLSASTQGAVPVVVGEIVAGVIVGRTGLQAIDTGNATLTFLGDIGFAMLMLSVGMNVPLHDRRLRTSLGRGTLAAAVAGVLAVAAGWLASRIGGAGHPAVYAVIIGSASAAIVLPVIQERGLAGPGVLTLIAQVTVADVAATIAIPFVLLPAKAGHVAAGTALIAAAVIALFALGHLSRRVPAVHAFRHEGKKRRWAIDLRLALIALFVLAWIAQRTGASLLVAGFGAGLMVAAIGGPKRLSTEVLGVAGGFFVPLFFVLLGARIDLRGIVRHPSMLALALALAGATAVVHVLAARLTSQPLATGLVASAQLGVPSAVVALGLSEHVITATQGAAIITAAMLSLLVCGVGAALMASSQRRASRAGTASAVAAPQSPAEPSHRR